MISMGLAVIFLLYQLFLPRTAFAEFDWRDPAMENLTLIEGDILEEESDCITKRSIVSSSNERWPGGKVPYVIDESLDDIREDINEAMEEFHRKTCVRFVPRKDEDNYVIIFSGKGCYSAQGRSGTGSQPLSIGENCRRTGIIIHELGHTLGLLHEHTRVDRDDYVIIHEDNIKEGRKYEFQKYSCRDQILYTLFDYDSIMIYGETTFSKDENLKTMEAKNGVKLIPSSEKKGLSKSDAEDINHAYNCRSYIESN